MLMVKDVKKILKYAAKLCIFGVVVLMIFKFALGRDLNGSSIIPILAMSVVANGISYILYKPKR